MASFKFLYSFKGAGIGLIEIKRTDLPERAPLSDIYKWLVITEDKEEVYALTFKSMCKDDHHEFRSFLEAELQFDKEQAVFHWSGKKYILHAHQFEASHLVNKSIDRYLMNC